jgi:hypothetical protein
VKTLRSIGDVVPAGSLGTVTDTEPVLLNGFDCYVELDVLVATDPAFPGRCFMFSDLEEL